MRIGDFLEATEVEGPGLRAALWVQGCSIRCPDCCNPQFLPFDGGRERDVPGLVMEICQLKVEGISIFGGEPLDQPKETLELLIGIRRNSPLGIILFTGYEWEEVRTRKDFPEIVQNCDLVKAGPFIKSLSPDSRKWIGSKNQTVHFITDRYNFLKDNWGTDLSEFEIHLIGDEIFINGSYQGARKFIEGFPERNTPKNLGKSEKFCEKSGGRKTPDRGG